MAKKPKDAQGAESAGGDEDRPYTIDDHPNARRSIEHTRSWAAVVSFALVTLMSVQAAVPAFDAGVRGLIAGVLAYVLAWSVAVTIWREVVRSELEAARQGVRERRVAAIEAMREAQLAAADAAAERQAGI